VKAISFEVGGKTAFFKKPDVNTYAYFTYNNIHKPALLGMLGAIIGLGGYTQLYDKNRGLKKGSLGYDNGYPEFYQKLQYLKISIIPLSQNGYFSKKIQVFNNSVGYASFEQGGNLIVREQWLENPKWQIIIIDDESDEYNKLKNYLFSQKTVFMPYLGKNDHFADINQVNEIELTSIYEDEGIYIDSLFIKNSDKIDGFQKDEQAPFLFQEVSPMRFQKDYHFYEYETLCFTNMELEEFPKDTFSYNNKNYSFI
jgi:CRISPR-associated protein Cas5h